MIGKVSQQKEGLTYLGKGDGSDNLINDGCDKYDDNCDDCGDSTPCNVLIIDSKKLRFPFSIGEGDLYNKVACLKSCLAKSNLGLGS